MSQTGPFMQALQGGVERKTKLYETAHSKYFVRTIYAGFLLTIGCLVGGVIAGHFQAMSPVLGKIIYSLIFPIGLIVVVFLNGELATSNMMYLTAGAKQGWVSYQKAFQIMLECGVGNWIGTALLVGLASLTIDFSASPYGDFYLAATATKLAKPLLNVFIDGILANVFVNIAIMGQMRMKDDTAKMLFIAALIASFVFLGYDHVVANYAMFLFGQLAGGGFAWSTILLHWLTSFIGNIVGGGFIMGWGYSWLNSDQTVYHD